MTNGFFHGIAVKLIAIFSSIVFLFGGASLAHKTAPHPNKNFASAIAATDDDAHRAVASTLAPPVQRTSTTSVQSDPTSPGVTERVIVNQVTLPANQDEVNGKLAALKNDLLTRIAQITLPAWTFSGPAESTPVSFQTFAQSQKIDNLAGVTISNATVHGLSGLTSADIPADIIASNYLPLSGGTLTGNLLIGTSGTAFGTDQGAQIEMVGSSATANPYIDWKNDASKDYDFRFQFNPSASRFSIGASSTANILNIKSNGYVGIGTVSPTAALHVANGQLYVLNTLSTAAQSSTEANDLIRGTFSYEGAADNAYTYEGSALQVRTSYGASNTNTAGTAHAISTHNHVFNSASSSSEVTPLFLDLTADAAARLWGTDFNVFGPTSTQADLIQGLVNFVGNYNSATINNGGFGASIVTYPGRGGGDGAIVRKLLQTYPLDAGLAIVGRSGTPDGVTKTNGYSRALQIGGWASGWMSSSDSSQFGTGADIRDYQDYGIYVHDKASGGLGTAIVVDSSAGNVAIGTTTSTSKLTVYGNVYGGDPTFHGDLLLSGNSGNTQSLNQNGGLEFKASGVSSGYGWRIIGPDLGNSNSPLVFQYRVGTPTWTEALRFTNAGNVGIGTTSPYSRLSVWGRNSTSGARAFDVTNSASTTNFYVDNGGLTWMVNLQATASSTIGDGTQAGGLTIFGGATTTGSVAITGTSGTTTIASGQGFAIGNSQFVVQQSSGRVGIGTTIPQTSLQVGDLNAGTAEPTQHGLIQIQGAAGIGGANTGLEFKSVSSSNGYGWLVLTPDRGNSNIPLVFASRTGSASWTERLTIMTGGANAGYVGIATGTPWRTLSVTGTVGFDGLTGSTGAGSLCLDANRQVVYNSGSDACLSSLRSTKHDIGDLSFDAISMVKALDPVSFVYNTGDGRTRYGFIAEDTAAVDAHLATYDASGTISGIDDRAIISIIVKALKDLITKLDNLAATVAEFAHHFVSDEIVANDRLCIKDTCVTRTQLQALLQMAGQQSEPISTPAPGSAHPDDSIASSSPEAVSNWNSSSATSSDLVETPADEQTASSTIDAQ